MPQPNQPEVFGKYHLLEKIATGGMAEVYRARSYGVAGFEKILVIKRILDNLAKDDEFIALFIDEARLAAQLLHTNIVQVFELGEVSGSYYMAMEYVHGLDLARLLSRARRVGDFSIPVALFIAREVLKALQFAHEQVDEMGRPLNVVHCDISPQNILISYAGEVKITDFGISRAAFQSAGAHQVIRGKYAYMSPEQVEGRPLDAQSDLFSIGIVMWEMLAGRRLFKTKSREETLNRVRRAEVPSLRSYRPEVSEDLEGLLLKALSKRPQDRMASAGELLEQLSILMVREGHRATNGDLSQFMKEVIEAVIAAGATTVNIPDTVGYAMPEQFAELIRYLRRSVPNIGDAVISVHCHDDLGLAVANSLAAVKAGARQVECTINGLGERAGNASLEEVVMAIKTRRDFFGKLRTNIRTERLYPTSRLVSSLTGIHVQRNKAVVGENAFAHEAGVHQDGILKHHATYEIMRPQDVGMPESKLVLGKHSGRHALRDRIAELGYTLTDAQVEEVFERFKDLADKIWGNIDAQKVSVLHTL